MRGAKRTIVASLLSVLCLVVAGSTALADVQSREQSRCIVDLNRAISKVARSAGQDGVRCLKLAPKGGLGTGGALECLTADQRGKVAKARVRAIDAERKRCGLLPDFGFSGGEAASAAAAEEAAAVALDLIGEPFDTLALNAAQVSCRTTTAKAWIKQFDAVLRVFNDCKKAGLAAGTIDSAAALGDDCLAAIDADPKGRIAKSSAKLGKILNSRCGGGAGGFLAGAFPGACAASASVTSSFLPCLESIVRCRACRTVDRADALDLDCDAFDDGVVQGSCTVDPDPTTTTTSTTLSTTTTSSTTTTVDLCSPLPDCSPIDTECSLGVCNPANGACTLAPVVAGTNCAASAPAAVITDVVLTDLSTADTILDGATDVNEWRHSIDLTSDGAGIDTALRGIVGADACCTVEDENLSVTAAYRLEFNVAASSGWRLTLAHSVLGAFSILDEKVALEDAGGEASIGVIGATVSVDGGTPVVFDAAASPASLVHALGGGEGDSDQEFSGNAGLEVFGTGNAAVVVEFQMGLTAFSNSNLTFPAAGGDEVAVRFGLADTIANGFTAGAYPSGDGSLADRDAAADGHRASIRIAATACEGAGTCDGAGNCDPSASEDCSTLDTECGIGLCDGETGSCVAENLPDGLGCEDGDPCTVGDTCSAGVCVGGPAPDCSGLDDACNVGVCEAQSGACVAAPLGAGTACGDATAGAVIANAVLTDLSTADTKLDGGFDVNEWRHATSMNAGPGRIDAELKAMLGADACCTVEDESLSATGSYRLSFDVVGAADWELEVAHALLGAFSILDEKVALEDAGGVASLTNVSGSIAVDGGSPVAFDFAPTPSSLTHSLGGGEGDSDVEVSGSASTTVVGSGPASVVVEFAFGATAFSNSNAAFPAAGGDEVAIRLGLSDTISNGFTAGAYPSGDSSLAARDAAADGHKASIVLRTVTCVGEATCDGEGSCDPGPATDCSASGDACNLGICDPLSVACSTEPEPAGTSCSDANACNGDEFCDGAGTCDAGVSVDCSSFDDQCNEGVCAPLTGACSASPLSDGLGCDDGDACTSGDVCAAGVCAGTEVPGCGATLANVSVTNLSDGNTKSDGSFDVNEFRRELTQSSDATSIDARMAAVIGADACCTTGDEDISRTASYSVSFDIVSSLSWELTLNQAVLGAFSLLDEKVANEDAGGLASVSGVSATVTINGAPTDLSFSVSPGSRSHAIGGGEGNSDVEFSGSDSEVILGSGNASVSIVVSYTMRAFSNSNFAFPAAGGDEVAVRMGLSDTISNGFTAGEYPTGNGALGSRNAALDGHFLTVDLIGTP